MRVWLLVSILGLAAGCTTRQAVSPNSAETQSAPIADTPAAPTSAPEPNHPRVQELTPYFDSGPLAKALEAYHAGNNDQAAAVFEAFAIDREATDERAHSARLLALLAHHDAGRGAPTGDKLDRLASDWPLLADYASFFAGSSHEKADRLEDAVTSLARVDEGSTLRGRAVALRARILARLDRVAEARTLVEKDLDRDANQLSHWKILADLHRAAGEAGPLRAALRELASRFPVRAAGRAALVELGVTPGLSLVQRLRVGRIYNEKHDRPRAIRALTAVVADAQEGGDVWCEATVLLGRAVEKNRAVKKSKRREQAWPHYERALRCQGDALASATFAGGRNRLGAGKYELAERLFAQHLDKFSDRTTADDVALLQADSIRQRGQGKLADQRLLQQLQRWPKGDMADAAAWALVWPRIAKESWSEAIAMADRALELVPRERSYRAEGRTAYWRAVALDALGRTDEALAGWTSVLRDYPLSWYALLSHSRLARAGKAEGTLKAILAEAVPPPDPLAAIPPSLANTTRFQKGVALARLGLPNNARREFARLEPTGDAEERRAWTWTLIALYDQVGAHDLATALARKEEPWLGRTWPVGPMKTLWELAHPRAFSELVIPWAEKRKIDPTWIWSIMREESGFNPTIESWANAVGLMQIIISTAKGLVRGTDIPPTKASLRKPEVAVELGSKLLAELYAEHPSIPLASTGYNAGSRATARWRRDFGHLELDRLVEHITFKEARGYAKRVSRSVARYTWLYGAKAAAGEGAEPGPPIFWSPGLAPPGPR